MTRNKSKKMIKHNEERLKTWSLPNSERKEIEKDIEELKKLLK